ncbi:MAG: S8 family serine peptidase, partial [Bacteroidota bacterium]
MSWKILILSTVVILCEIVNAQSGLRNKYVVKLKSGSVVNIGSFSKRLQKISGTINTFSVKSISPTGISSALSKKNSFPYSQYLLVESNSSVQDITKGLSDSDVEYIQPVNYYHIASLPNDSAYASQWNMEMIGMKSVFVQQIIDSNLPTIKVGVIDTGIDFDHPDISGAIALNYGEIGVDSTGNDKRSNGIDDDANGYIDDWRGYDFVELDSKDGSDWSLRDNFPQDENGHGTGVSGIIGARSNNTIGISGFGPVQLIPVRAFSASGVGSDLDIAMAIVYAADNGAEVINMSFGDVINSLIIKDAVQYAAAKNVALVASSGNDGGDYQHYPSDLSDVISVGSINQIKTRSIFSSYGNSLAVMAPGEFIPTLKLGGGYTENFSGTSAAAPHVSGAVALIKGYEKSVEQDPQRYITSRELKGLLTSTAVDVDLPGWDEFTASGIINVEEALRSMRGSNVQIVAPLNGENISDTLDVMISALSPYFESLSLLLKKENSNENWVSIYKSSKQVFNLNIKNINLTGYSSGDYLLKLRVKTTKGNDLEHTIKILLSRDFPKIEKFTFSDSVIVTDEFASLVEAETNIPTEGVLFYRLKNSSDRFHMLRSENFGREHFFLLNSSLFQSTGDFEFYTQFFENVDFSKKSTLFPMEQREGFKYFSVENTNKRISSTVIEKIPLVLPKGFLLNTIMQINGKPTIVMNEYSGKNEFGDLKLFQFENGAFVQKDSISQKWIPRSFIRNENDIPILLTQNFGTSAIYTIDTITMNFSKKPVWIDSGDVWGSVLEDLNGDHKPEIVARSSSEILIFENIGNNQFRIKSKLQNPTKPLFGETQNQFGPPKIVIADFTNSGLKELVFADYDGDIIMYSQNNHNSLAFTLSWIDSTNLFETSDFIAADDFNNDGITDLVFGGHSDLALNANREYNVPVWTVQIYAHRQSDPSGYFVNRWTQKYFGVKSGAENDNGISSGELQQYSISKNILMLNLNPNFYLYSFSPDFSPETIGTRSSFSNSAIIFNEKIGINTGEKTEFFQWSNSQPDIALTPWNFSVRPISFHSIRLQWNGEGDYYQIYKGTTKENLALIDSTSGLEYVDSSVAMDNEYYYSVRSVKNNGPALSEMSSILSVIPHLPLKITAVRQISTTQLVLDCSYEIDPSLLQTAAISMDDSLLTSSVIASTPKNIVTTFSSLIEPGTHSL